MKFLVFASLCLVLAMAADVKGFRRLRPLRLRPLSLTETEIATEPVQVIQVDPVELAAEQKYLEDQHRYFMLNAEIENVASSSVEAAPETQESRYEDVYVSEVSEAEPTVAETTVVETQEYVPEAQEEVSVKTDEDRLGTVVKDVYPSSHKFLVKKRKYPPNRGHSVYGDVKYSPKYKYSKVRSSPSKYQPSCDFVKPQPNFDISRSMGTWFFYAASSNFPDLNSYCLARNYDKIVKNKLYSTTSFVDESDKLARKRNITRLDDCPAIQYTTEVIKLYGKPQHVPVRVTTVYTDYNNIMVNYVCGTCLKKNRNKKLYNYYYILVRDRRFDSAAVLSNALNALGKVDPTATYSTLVNPLTCPKPLF